MADTKISALTAAGALDGTEQLPIVQGGTTKRTTLDDALAIGATGRPPMPYRSGAWYGRPGMAGFSGAAMVDGRLYGLIHEIQAAISIQQVQVGLSATSTGNIRMGWYEVGSDGKPGALVHDLGTVSAGATPCTITNTHAMAAGWYYFGIAAQGGTPSIRISNATGSTGTTESPLAGVQANPASSGPASGCFYVAASGALPTPFGASTLETLVVPQFYYRIA